jgi:hypothetical protein
MQGGAPPRREISRLPHCPWLSEVDPFGAQMGVELAHLQVITMHSEFTAPRSREKLAFRTQPP